MGIEGLWPWWPDGVANLFLETETFPSHHIFTLSRVSLVLILFFDM